MSKDFANQKPSRPTKRGTKKSKKQPSRNKRKNQSEEIQWGTFGIGMIFGILCTLAAAFLPAQFSGEKGPSNVEDSADGKSSLEKQAPKTNFEFFDRLPKEEVRVKRGSYESLSAKTEGVPVEYYLQAVSFRNPDDASKVKAELLLSGLTANTERTTINGVAWYRVLVGPFSNRTALNRAQTKLREQNLSPLPIKRLLPD